MKSTFYLGLLAIAASSSPAHAAAEEVGALYAARMKPFIETYCVSCHGAKEPEAGVNLSGARSSEQLADEQDLWFRILEQLQTEAMPPIEAKQPSAAEYAAAAAWIRNDYVAALRAQQQAEGRSKLRRLTRAEYSNTIEDLFGIRPLVERNLPPDGRVDGYDKVAAALPLSSEGSLGYFQMAEELLRTMIRSAPRPKRPLPDGTLRPDENAEANRTTRVPAFQSEQSKGHILELPDGWMVSFNSDTTSGPMKFNCKVPGRHMIRLSVYGYQTDKPLPFGLYVIKSGGLTQELELARVLEAPPGKPTVLETEIYLQPPQGLRLIPFGLGVPVPKNHQASECRAPGLAFQWMEDVAPTTPHLGYDFLTADFTDALKSELLVPRRQLVKGVAKPTKPEIPQELRAALPTTFKRIGAALFRRDLTEQEVAALTNEVATRYDAGELFSTAYLDRVTEMLTSANFLCVVEQPGSLDDFALAARLSYFLWNSAPDAQLLEVARSGKLREPAVLKAQTERLLHDPKSRRFVADFTDQWLGVRGIDDTTPDQKLYPEYARNELLKHASVDETHQSFGRMLDENLSVRDFVAPSWAIVNEPLAQLYGLPDVTGAAMRQVKLPADSPHGGFWTQSAVLKVTANGSYTSPVKRGVWMAERLLGNLIPPPPPDVGAVDPDTRGAKTLREQLALHSKQGSCKACHAKFDPYGFALESFDVTGAYRTTYRVLNAETTALPPGQRKGQSLWREGLPVDCSGETPDGRKFADIQSLRRILADDPQPLARGVVRHLITYAIGARPNALDEPTVQAIVAAASPNDFGLRSLVHAVVQSELFRNK